MGGGVTEGGRGMRVRGWRGWEGGGVGWQMGWVLRRVLLLLDSDGTRRSWIIRSRSWMLCRGGGSNFQIRSSVREAGGGGLKGLYDGYSPFEGLPSPTRIGTRAIGGPDGREFQLKQSVTRLLPSRRANNPTKHDSPRSTRSKTSRSGKLNRNNERSVRPQRAM